MNIIQESYTKLQLYYKEMIELFDFVHSNSSVTESIYNKYYILKGSQRINITHSNIEDNRVARTFGDDILNITFIGSSGAYKGLPLLREVLKELYSEGLKKWELNIWGCKGEDELININYRGGFNSSELNKVFNKDGLLIVPSICFETFGFTALEAISFGIPAMVSSTVGAKDVVEEYDAWFVFEDKKDLNSKLKTLLEDNTLLKNYNKEIMTQAWKHDMASHALKIEKLYQ